jgi:hypothetical protein
MFDPYFGNATDDDLLAMGRQAGYLPEAEPEPSDTIAPAAPPAMSQGLEAPSYIPNNLLGTPSGAPSDSRGSIGVGASQRGFSQDKYAQVSKTQTGLAAEEQAADARALASAQNQQGIAQYAHRSKVDAAKAEAAAKAKQISAGGEQALVMQRLHDDFAIDEVRANAEANALANQAKTDYLAALADFRASKVDPGQLWGNMTGGERFGMLASAFVHDFLGARGINTSAMATFNKAIDRNIDAQIQNLKTKGEVAEGFKSLWWMQRNQSASDAEARSRVRGFMLEGAKQAVIANMAQYESALATAQGQAAIAKIDEELSKTLIEVYQHADQNAIHLRNQAIEKWKAKLQASLEQQSINLRAQELDLAKKKADREAKVGIEPIYDPETGKALWYYKPGITEKEKVDTRERLEGLAGLNEQFNELRELSRQMDSVADPVARTRLAGTVAQKMDSLATRMAHNFAKANDERATDKDVVDFLKGMKMKTWLNQGDVDEIIAFTHKNMIAPAMHKVRNVGFDMPEELVDSWGVSASKEPFAGAMTDARATANPLPKAMDDIHREDALKTAAGTPGRQPLEEERVTAPVKRHHEELVKSYPHVFTSTAKPGDVLGGGEQRPANPIMSFEQSHVELARLAKKARTEGVPDKDNKALNQLKQVASGLIINSDDPDAISASHALYTIDQE